MVLPGAGPHPSATGKPEHGANHHSTGRWRGKHSRQGDRRLPADVKDHKRSADRGIK